MKLGYLEPLYMLAFDHRGSFQKGLFGLEEPPRPEERERISDTKQVIFEGFELALGGSLSRENAGVLVDEEFGSDVARKAHESGVILAMPVEKSGQAEFDFEFGESFGDHVEDFDPTFAKVLVRYNPGGDSELNHRQSERLARLSDWLHDHGRRLLFELLVPAEPDQIGRVGGDQGRYDREVRPGLVLDAIAELQARGVEPDIWKIEGLDEVEDYERVSRQVRRDGRDDVRCIVLGRGASEEAVVRWLRLAAGVAGFSGFAVGRTLWWNELKEYVAGTLQREDAARRIAENYKRMFQEFADGG